MLIEYDWPDDEDPPAVGTVVEVSGDPDCPVLKGVVAKVNNHEIAILMADGQLGAQAFAHWISTEGNVGVSFPGAQDLLPRI